MFLKKLEQLTRIRKCSLGKYQTLKKIDKKVYSVYFKKTNQVKILKKVSENDYGLNCTYKKHLKKTNKNKYGCKGEKNVNVKSLMFKEEIKNFKNIKPFYWSMSTLKNFSKTPLCMSSAFLNECSINDILKENVSCYSSYFCKYELAWKSKRQGNILMEYGGKSLVDICRYLGLQSIQIIVFQVLLALSCAQQEVHFKHQDLHTGNIYVLMDVENQHIPKNVYVLKAKKELTHPETLLKNYKKTKEKDQEKDQEKNQEKKQEKEQEKILYTLPYSLPIKIADFGFSSATNPKTFRRHCRADFDMLENGKKWGEFNEVLHGNEGYDMLYFLSILKEDVRNKEAYLWIKSIIKKIFDLQGHKIKISTYGRPLENCKVHPHEIIESEFFKDWRNETLQN